MKVGFTGTRSGIVDAQWATLGTMLALELLPAEFHHGSCRGADVQAAGLTRHVRGGACRIICHPGPDDDPNRDVSGVDDEVLPPKTHFARNRDIVDGCDLLIACPPCRPLPDRGGTAYTVNYARKQGRPLKIIWPDGSVSEEA